MDQKRFQENERKSRDKNQQKKKRVRDTHRLLKTINIKDLGAGRGGGAQSGGRNVDEDGDGHLLGDPVGAEGEKEMEQRAEEHG